MQRGGNWTDIVRRWSRSACVAILAVGSLPALAQQPAAPAGNAPELQPAAPGDQIVVKREPVQIIDAAKYRASLVLQPEQVVAVAAPAAGVVREIPVKLGDRIPSQGEVVRLDNAEAKLLLARATALYKVATLEQKQAGSDQAAADIAAAKTEAAKAELDLAQLRFDQSTVRTTIAGEVLELLVRAGETVSPGQPLARVGSRDRLVVEIPVDRTQVEAGQSISLLVDATEVAGKVEVVLPLAVRFDPLRDLFDSIASARVVIENTGGKLNLGQTVYSPMIPRLPIIEVPSGAVGNGAEGGRKVQVVRGQTVRDVPVQVLAGVGPGRTFVSGSFLSGDEVIYESSHLLADGFQLQPVLMSTADRPTGTPAAPNTRPGAPAAPGAKSKTPTF